MELEGGIANFSDCNLEKLPDEVFKWIEAGLLKELNISGNMFQALPVELRHVKKVEVLRNPLQTIPVDIRSAKWAKIKKYLDTIATKAASWDIRKLLFVGEEAVGKSVSIFSFSLLFPSPSPFLSPFPFILNASLLINRIFRIFVFIITMNLMHLSY